MGYVVEDLNTRVSMRARADVLMTVTICCKLGKSEMIQEVGRGSGIM